MADEELSINVRLQALEILVAFLFAAQHMQTTDPAAAVSRLRSMLLEQFADRSSDAKDRNAVLAALEREVQHIQALQAKLPIRLVD